MQSPETTVDFTGQVLIAMPGMGDPRFDRSVIYMCSHSDKGAMGLIVNKPNRGLRFGDLLEQMSIETSDETPDMPVYFGGPVEHGRGFVLHSRDYVSDISTLEVSPTFAMTATQDILEDIVRLVPPPRVPVELPTMLPNRSVHWRRTSFCLPARSAPMRCIAAVGSSVWNGCARRTSRSPTPATTQSCATPSG